MSIMWKSSADNTLARVNSTSNALRVVPYNVRGIQAAPARRPVGSYVCNVSYFESVVNLAPFNFFGMNTTSNGRILAIRSIVLVFGYAGNLTGSYVKLSVILYYGTQNASNTITPVKKNTSYPASTASIGVANDGGTANGVPPNAGQGAIFIFSETIPISNTGEVTIVTVPTNSGLFLYPQQAGIVGSFNGPSGLGLIQENISSVAGGLVSGFIEWDEYAPTVQVV